MQTLQIDRIALLGNPNSGKSTLFNVLTGLNQKVGNFPGVTVDRKSGLIQLKTGKAEIIDLPGCYSLYPRSADEQVVVDTLLNTEPNIKPQAILLVADITNLERSLLLILQVLELNIPTVLALNMSDIKKKIGLSIDLSRLSESLGAIPIVEINAREGNGISELLQSVNELEEQKHRQFYATPSEIAEVLSAVKQQYKFKTNYEAYLMLHHYKNLHFLSERGKTQFAKAVSANSFNADQAQKDETSARYQSINQIYASALIQIPNRVDKLKLDVDKILTHRIFGYLIFFLILLLIFQAIFAWSSVPMDIIDAAFAQLSETIKSVLPAGVLTDLIAEGIIPGIGGIVIFIPQIVVLFGFIAILEDTGYMARVVFLMDKLMRKVGLNGKSIVPLISGLACAIPAIMATRNIDSWKDRLITIMVTPLMSCSARLPVYTILIALVVPSTYVWGFINVQGLVLMLMYMIGFLAAILAALVMKHLLKSDQKSFLIMEMPTYRSPRWKSIGVTVIEKAKTFVFEAGKIILAVSIILWVLASYGPGESMNEAEQQVRLEQMNMNLDAEKVDLLVERTRLEHSYAGNFGRLIEPVIAPLGYDWKIGIALITSFAAREVFVGTISTLYAIGEDFQDDSTIVSRMRSEINPATGNKVFTLAVAVSLLLFYAFAMQCMSTVAVVYRETKGWKWPLIQTVYMTALAYISALVAFQILN